MNSTEFFLKWNKKPNDNGTYKGQCVNVIHSYFEEVLGIPKYAGNAIDYWNKPLPGFVKVTKTPTNQPNPGDIIVFNIGPNGHIAVCNWSRVADFGGFEQNFPVGSPCHYQDHKDYKNVLGWLVYKPAAVGPVPFVMKYTCFNVDPSLMQEARDLMKRYSKDLIDLSFEYKTIIPITVPGLYSTDDQVKFVADHPTQTPFNFLRYVSANTPNYDYMSTNEVAGGSNKIMTISEGGASAFGVCYEMTHAIQIYARQKGFPMSIDDVNTPDETFLLKKLNQVLPYIGKLS